MRKFILALLVIGIVPNFSFSQNDYSKLKELFENGDFKKAEQKATFFTYNAKYIKDPEPYIYRSMVFYEYYLDSLLFKKSNWYDEVHPLKQAVVDAVSFRKRDKKNQYFPKYEAYINKLKNELITRGEFYFNEGNFKKANKYYKYMIKMDPSDPTGLLMVAICDLKTDKLDKAQINLDKAMNKISGIKELSKLREEEQSLLKKGLMELASHLAKNEQSDDARLTIDFGYIHFQTDTEYNEKYEEIMSI